VFAPERTRLTRGAPSRQKAPQQPHNPSSGKLAGSPASPHHPRANLARSPRNKALESASRAGIIGSIVTV